MKNDNMVFIGLNTHKEQTHRSTYYILTDTKNMTIKPS